MSPDEALSDTDRRCKHMVRYPHECRDCEAEADAAHRASDEGGSPSALRASAPEGQDERQWMFQWLVPYEGWGRVTFCAMPLDRAEELWRRSHPDQHDYEVWTPLKIVRGLTGPTASVEAGPSRGAPAPLAPEGLRADPGIDESLLHDIAGDPRFAATVSEYLSNRCPIGVLITATLRTAARVGYVPGHLASTQAQARTPSAASAASAPEDHNAPSGDPDREAVARIVLRHRDHPNGMGSVIGVAEEILSVLRARGRLR